MLKPGGVHHHELFLRLWWCERELPLLWEQALNAAAREMKDPEQLMKLIPGVKSWKE